MLNLNFHTGTLNTSSSVEFNERVAAARSGSEGTTGREVEVLELGEEDVVEEEEEAALF